MKIYDAENFLKKKQLSHFQEKFTLNFNHSAQLSTVLEGEKQIANGFKDSIF